MAIHSSETDSVSATVDKLGVNTWTVKRKIIIIDQASEVIACHEALASGTPDNLAPGWTPSSQSPAWCTGANSSLESRVKVGSGEGLLFTVSVSYSNSIDESQLRDDGKSRASEGGDAGEGGGDGGEGEGGGGAGAGGPQTSTSFISRMVPFPAANSCGDPFNPPIEQEKYSMKITTVETVNVGDDAPGEAMNEGLGAVGAIDPNFSIEGLNIPEDQQALCTQNDLGPVQLGPAGRTQTKTTTHVVDSFNPVKLLDVGYTKCDGEPFTVTDPATGFEIPIVGPMAVSDAILEFDVFPVQGE